jgi:cobalamin transport system substrate-binding protein
MLLRYRCLAAVMLAAACAAPSRTPAGPPARVVSLAPSVTEIVYALGAGDRLVGVCAQCDDPAAAALPRVGGYLTPSVEETLALRPALVVVVPSPGNREAVRAIERAGVRVLVVRDRTLADLWASIRDVSSALGVAAAGETLLASVQRRLDVVRTDVAGLPRPRVLAIVGHRPLVAVGPGTLQDELIAIAGGDNVMADAAGAWPTLTLELVVARAPDVIIDASMGTEEGLQGLFSQLKIIPAVRAGRVVRLADAGAFLRAGPRVADAAAALAAVVHPSAVPAGAGTPG